MHDERKGVSFIECDGLVVSEKNVKKGVMNNMRKIRIEVDFETFELIMKEPGNDIEEKIRRKITPFFR